MRLLHSAIGITTLGIVIACRAMAGPVDAEWTREVISACNETAGRYAWLRDRLEYEAYGDLFTEDGVFAIGSQETVGRGAIIEALKARGADQTTRHVITPVRIEVIDRQRATGISYLQLYSATGRQQGDEPLGIQGPAAIAEYHDEFRMTDAGCKFAARRVKLIFIAAQPDG